MFNPGSAEPLSLTHVSLTEVRPGRVTIEWTLGGVPTPEWIDAFDESCVLADFHTSVPSAYGRPLVVLEGSVIWSVTEDQVRAAHRLVEQAVTGTGRLLGERWWRQGNSVRATP